MNSELSAKFTFWCNRIIALVVVALIFFFPPLIDWFEEVRPLGERRITALIIGFYLCVPVVLYALWCIDRLVTNVLKKDIFVEQNVRYIRRLRWCCAGVSLICVPIAFFYMPLIFMVVIMAFLALVISLVKNVMAAAVEIREENEFTI